MQAEKIREQYLNQVLVASLTFVATYSAAMIGARWMLLGVPAQLTLATLASAAFAWFIFAEIQLLRQLDELQKRIQLEALAIAFPLALLLLMMLGLLERITGLPKDDLSYRHVWPIVALFYFVGMVFARRRYL